ncbi:MAG: hypothetical protein LBQ38_00430, partial [Spirochaetaceae bacterium]|nr:hypothetical protein [Spirochaetaceae bacterium]
YTGHLWQPNQDIFRVNRHFFKKVGQKKLFCPTGGGKTALDWRRVEGLHGPADTGYPHKLAIKLILTNLMDIL